MSNSLREAGREERERERGREEEPREGGTESTLLWGTQPDW